jgi:hypothetical protein
VKILCPKCGTRDWETVNLCMGCVRRDQGPITLALHSCSQVVTGKCDRHEMDVLPGCGGCILEMLRNLLAVIHGDGGHHTEWFGLMKSVQDAMDKVQSKERSPE